MALRIHTAFGSSGVKSRLSPRPVCPVGANATFSQVRQRYKSPEDSPQEILIETPRKNYTKRDVLVFLRQSQVRVVYCAFAWSPTQFEAGGEFRTVRPSPRGLTVDHFAVKGNKQAASFYFSLKKPNRLMLHCASIHHMNINYMFICKGGF